ncbi:tetratricopeptide repeat protein [Candidatus Woesearchaeota archaeon]|nr:tetratricopeptide repeat protein [Candidatus Woesearchaeota archaeon]
MTKAEENKRKTKKKETKAEDLVEQGKSLLKERKFDKAKDVFEKAVELDPNFPKIYSYLIPIYHELKMDANAVQAYKNAIELDQNDLVAHYHLGVMSLKKKQFMTAKKLFKKVIDVNRRHVGAIFGFGLASFRTGNLAAAKKCFEYVSKADPKNAVAKKYCEVLEKQ